MKQHSTAYENTKKKKGYYNKTWPQIIWFCSKQLGHRMDRSTVAQAASEFHMFHLDLRLSATGNKYK